MKTILMTDRNGKEVYFDRISRWITVRENYSPSPSNSLWDYVQDGWGYHPSEDKFNPDEGLYLNYFKFDGRTYAIDQFYLLGSMWIYQTYKYEENGETHYLSAVDMDGDIYHPLYVEFDEYCERVRVYRQTPRAYIPMY